MLYTNDEKGIGRFPLFKIRQKNQKSDKNKEKIWVQKRLCNVVFYTKIYTKNFDKGNVDGRA